MAQNAENHLRRVFACVLDDDPRAARMVLDEIGHIVDVSLGSATSSVLHERAHIDHHPAVGLGIVLFHLVKADQLLSAGLLGAGHLFDPRSIIEQDRSRSVCEALLLARA